MLRSWRRDPSATNAAPCRVRLIRYRFAIVEPAHPRGNCRARIACPQAFAAPACGGPSGGRFGAYTPAGNWKADASTAKFASAGPGPRPRWLCRPTVGDSARRRRAWVDNEFEATYQRIHCPWSTMPRRPHGGWSQPCRWTTSPTLARGPSTQNNLKGNFALLKAVAPVMMARAIRAYHQY